MIARSYVGVHRWPSPGLSIAVFSLPSGWTPAGGEDASTRALAAARPHLLVQAVLYPVVALVDVLTRQLGALVGVSQAIERPYTDPADPPSCGLFRVGFEGS